MTNEGLIFGVSVSGIALVILIIVLVVKHRHKDKYEPLPNRRIGATGAGCCSLQNNPSNCGTGDPGAADQGDWDYTMQCRGGETVDPTLAAAPDRCICNGSGTCEKGGGANGSTGSCSCKYNLDTATACGTCKQGFIPDTKCTTAGVPCPDYPKGAQCGKAPYTESCTATTQTGANNKIDTACKPKAAPGPPPPPPAKYWCRQDVFGPYNLGAGDLTGGNWGSGMTVDMTRNLQKCGGSDKVCSAGTNALGTCTTDGDCPSGSCVAQPSCANKHTWDTYDEARRACGSRVGLDGSDCASSAGSANWCTGCNFGNCDEFCHDLGRQRGCASIVSWSGGACVNTGNPWPGNNALYVVADGTLGYGGTETEYAKIGSRLLNGGTHEGSTCTPYSEWSCACGPQASESGNYSFDGK